MEKKKLKNLKFMGTFSHNTYPKLEDKQCCIINNENNTEDGEHWLTIFNDKNKIYIYDSFDRDTFKDKSLNFPKNYKEVKNIPSKIEQKIWESNCGARCISVIMVCDKYGVKNFFNLS